MLAAGRPASAIVTAPKKDPAASLLSSALAPPIWHDSVKMALTRAAAEYQPVLVLFSSPDCPWCLRLKAEMLQDPDTLALLRHFSLAEINVSGDPQTANAYQVSYVPIVMILSASGDIQQRAEGYLPQPDLRDLLKGALNPEFLRQQDPAYSDLLKLLSDNAVPAGKWPEIMTALGSPEKRKALHDAILELNPFPAKDLAALLQNRRLAVRLGALEILEELTGDSFGFDPWKAPNSSENKTAENNWTAWALSTNTQVTLYAALTQDQINAYIRDLVSDHPDSSRRARQMLRHGGASVADALAAFLEHHPDLAPATAKTIQETQYAAILTGIDGIDSDALAHRLVFGSLDVRQNNIPKLLAAGSGAIRILRDFLDDPDPMLREAAVDTLIGVNPRSALPLLEQRLKTEPDQEVVCTILRGLGRVKSKKGLAVLTSYLANSNEDLVITALNSVARLKTRTALEPVAACLADPRWRVRVAALETVGALKADTLADKVTQMLKDPDEFTRHSAVKALTLISAKKSAPKLEEAFLQEDGLKGAIVAAFVSMELPLPASFKPALAGKSPDVLLAVLDSIDSDCKANSDLAMAFVNHENLDVACAAIRLVAKHGMKNAAWRGPIIEILTTGKREMKLAALEAIPAPAPKDRTIYDTRPTPGPAPSGTASNPPALIDSLLNDFLGEGAATGTNAPEQTPSSSAPPKSTSAASKDGSVDDIFATFSGSDARPTTSASPGSEAPAAGGGRAYPRDSVERLLQATEKLLISSDPEICFQAALLLTRYGCPTALDYLQSGLAERPVDERQAIAASLARITGGAAIPGLRLLFADPAESVRQAAIASSLEHAENPALLDALFEELMRRETRLKPYELYHYELSRISRQSAAKQQLAKWARRLIAESMDPATRILGLVLLEGNGARSDDNIILPFVQSPEPFLRRAACHALGKLDKHGFTNLASAAAADPSEYVRMVVPDIYHHTPGKWLHYFDKEHFLNTVDYSFDYSSRERLGRSLPSAIEALLFRLTRDPSPKVRIEAFLCLIENHKTVNLADFVKTIDSFPDRNEIQSRITNYLTSNYEKLDRSFSVLGRYLKEEYGDSERIEKVRKHFAMDEDDEATATAPLARASKPPETDAVFRKAPESKSAGETPKIDLVLFITPGCSECVRVEKLLPALNDLFPWLNTKTYDLRTASAMQMNEALCDKFGVPDNLRLVSPTVFASAGFLIKKDITFDRLSELLARSAAMSPEDWLSAAERELTAAGQAIARRYQTLAPLLVAFSGLLDGVNPCAFATLIFLISYLQITRKKPREMAQVAMAFVIGVFLAYLGLGFGLAGIISRIVVLKKIGAAFNLALAAMALILMVLNVRDGILCLRGRLSETTLQLPAFLKKATHIAIRLGARHAHFVTAAFFVGIVISFLELACTGQVYAPTIGFIVQTRGITFGAAGLLLLYNTAFILPLIVVFVLVYSGMTADKLTYFLQRHIAAVKFSTATLFLVLFLVFVVWNSPL